jgi:hypothetical protein
MVDPVLVSIALVPMAGASFSVVVVWLKALDGYAYIFKSQV